MTRDPIAAFYKRFLWICEERGINQAELARLLHTSRQTVNPWFLKTGMPGGEYMIMLPSKKVLDCSPGWFLSGIGHPDDHREEQSFAAGVKWASGKVRAQLERMEGGR